MKLGGNRPPGDNPILFPISGTGSFICTDTARHTKAFDYPVAEHWGRRSVQFREWDSDRQHIGPESNALPAEPARFPRHSILLHMLFCFPTQVPSAVKLIGVDSRVESGHRCCSVTFIQLSLFEWTWSIFTVQCSVTTFSTVHDGSPSTGGLYDCHHLVFQSCDLNLHGS